MQTSKADKILNAQVLDEAACWFVEISEHSLDSAERATFDAWLRRSPEHVRAYLETAVAWEGAKLIDRHGCHDVDALIAMASRDHNVIPLGAVRALAPGAAAGRLPETRRLVLAASVAAMACGVVIAAWLAWFRAPIHATDTAEQQSVVLADGSTVALDARSRIRVDFTTSRRAVELLQGQALFDVVRDASRPFTVRSGETRVVAVGTRFDVDRRAGRTVVTVVEGRVSVETAEEKPRTLLDAGQQLIVAAQSVRPAQPATADVVAATAWTRRRLVFSATPLADVAEEYNRHHERQLVIRDAGLNGFNISGSFSSVDATALIDFLRAQPGVLVRETQSAFEVDSTGRP